MMKNSEIEKYLENLAINADPLAWTSMLRFWDTHYKNLYDKRFYRISGMLSKMNNEFPEKGKLVELLDKVVSIYQKMDNEMPRFMEDTISMDERYQRFNASTKKDFDIRGPLAPNLEAAKMQAAKKVRAVLNEEIKRLNSPQIN